MKTLGVTAPLADVQQALAQRFAALLTVPADLT
jgi:hypothetical protein